jgi:branched-chain amino acid transport system substrate-binding protein
VLSLSGAARAEGREQLDAIRLAVAQANRSGRPLLRLAVVDDGSDPARAAAAMRRLVDRRGAVVVLGPTLSQSALRADPVAARRRTPVVAVSNTADGVVGPWVWRDSLGLDVSVPAEIASVVQREAPARAVVLGGRGDLLGAQEARAAQRAFARNGVAVLPVASVAAAVAAEPDVVFVGASFSATAAATIRALRRAGFHGTIVGGAAALQLAGPTGRGVESGTAWFAGNAFAANVDFVRAYERAYRRPPDELAVQAYVGVQIVARALAESGVSGPLPARRARLEDALGGVALWTAMGPIRFTPSHDVDQIVWIVRLDGRGRRRLVGFCVEGRC